MPATKPHPSSNELDDILLERWRRGDRRAGDQLVLRYVADVRAYFGFRGTGPDTEDLVQETFSRLTRAIHGFEQRSTFRTYLLKIACNTMTDYLRRGYRHGRHESFDDTACAEDTDAEQKLLDAERWVATRACIQRLAPEQRRLVELFYFQDISTRAIAKAESLPDGTVRRRLYDVRGIMRRDLEEVSRMHHQK